MIIRFIINCKFIWQFKTHVDLNYSNQKKHIQKNSRSPRVFENAKINALKIVGVYVLCVDPVFYVQLHEHHE